VVSSAPAKRHVVHSIRPRRTSASGEQNCKQTSPTGYGRAWRSATPRAGTARALSVTEAPRASLLSGGTARKPSNFFESLKSKTAQCISPGPKAVTANRADRRSDPRVCAGRSRTEACGAPISEVAVSTTGSTGYGQSPSAEVAVERAPNWEVPRSRRPTSLRPQSWTLPRGSRPPS
jgi:hypothetical protein